MRRLLIVAPLLLCLACQGEVYDREGIQYARGQIGLGIIEKDVPNLIEYDIPVMKMKVTSPVLEKSARMSLIALGGVIGWADGLVQRLFSFVGLAQ